MRIISNVESWISKAISKKLSIDTVVDHLPSSYFFFNSDKVELIIGFSSIRNLTEAGNFCDVLRYLGKRKKISSITFLSSYGVYEPCEIAFKENSPLQPKNLVGNIALTIENTLKYLSDLTGLTLNIIRLFNLYGPGQNEPYIIPTILKQMVNSGTVFIGDSQKIRDFLYIDDFLSLLEIVIAREKAGTTKVFNAGSGKPVSIEHLLNLAQKLTGKKCDVIFDALRIKEEYDYDFVVANIDKACKELDWAPGISLETGLTLTYQWILGRSGKGV